jgi:NAD(P)-dependent dehydrogenase (short-subunit alcohol dehydrogenase family)
MSGRLEDKVAVISGGAGGAGRSASLLFAREGARVAILDFQEEAGAATVEAIRSQGGETRFVPTDVSQENNVVDAVKTVIDAFGRIDVLFNHAGTLIVKPFLETTPDDWRRLLDINLMGMIHTCRAVIPHMLDQGGGAIVNTSSISGLTAAPLESAYCVSKAACLQLTRAIAVEFRDRNIRCNALGPGFIRTGHGMRELEALNAAGEPATEDDITRLQGRMCEPEEVAQAALFLASAESSFVNGEILVIDNGAMAAT